MFLKLLLLGAAKVGKSSLLSRFCSSRSFEPGYHETVGADFGGTKVRLQNGLEAVVQIWDLPGNHVALAAMDPPPQTYMTDTHVCVLVCDMCSKDSFLALERIRAEFLAAVPKTRDSTAFVLLISKAEPTHAKKQAVFAADVLSWCSKHNIRHFYEVRLQCKADWLWT
jgi:small GTP-binding protein